MPNGYIFGGTFPVFFEQDPVQALPASFLSRLSAHEVAHIDPHFLPDLDLLDSLPNLACCHWLIDESSSEDMVFVFYVRASKEVWLYLQQGLCRA